MLEYTLKAMVVEGLAAGDWWRGISVYPGGCGVYGRGSAADKDGGCSLLGGCGVSTPDEGGSSYVSSCGVLLQYMAIAASGKQRVCFCKGISSSTFQNCANKSHLEPTSVDQEIFAVKNFLLVAWVANITCTIDPFTLCVQCK